MNSSFTLKLESISKTFSSETGLKVNVLEDINLEIPFPEPGSFVSFLAPFGSGKSTLLKIIAGLLEPSEGRVLHNNLPQKITPYIPEKPSSFPWLNVVQNVELGLLPSNNNEQNITKLISLVGLSGYKDHFPQNKSIGFRFRISLARALAINPSLILIDDSFRLMKEESREEVYNLLTELRFHQKQNFILATTNVVEAILLSDKIFLMSKKPGRIIKTIEIDRKVRSETRIYKSEKFTTIKSEIEAAFEESESLTTINYSV